MMHLPSNSCIFSAVSMLVLGAFLDTLRNGNLIVCRRCRDHAGAIAKTADQPLLGEEDFDAFVGSSNFEGMDGSKSDDGDLPEEEE